VLARSPQEICTLFQRYMAEGNLESVLDLYDPEAVFIKESGEVTDGREALKAELAPLAAARTRFDFTSIQIAEADDIALMHTDWTISGTETRQVHAIEVARRHRDGTWRWLIGDPFTVGRATSGSRSG
jgi:uncharacterized protein (TIGR02246 family)